MALDISFIAGFMHNYSQYTDQALFLMVAESDDCAYTEIYKRYSRLLHNHAVSKLQDPEEAKDVVQELFVNLWDKRKRIQLEHNLAAYLFRALRNKILNIYAHRKIESNHLNSLQIFLDQKPFPADYATRQKQLNQLIEQEIENLPKKMKEIFFLSRKDQLSNKEIAQQLNLSEKTVKNQVNNALKQLRSKFGPLIFLLYLLNN